MAEGFVMLRRGILEHLETGKVTIAEFGTYVYLITKANHATGTWKGCGKTLSTALHCSTRTAQRLLASLAKKGYLIMERPLRHYGAYLIRIVKYFRTAPPVATFPKNSATTDAVPPKTAPPVATLQEVRQEHYEEKSRCADPPTALKTEQEQRRIVEARDLRVLKERQASQDAQIGAGPKPALTTTGGTMEGTAKVVPGYIEFSNLRSAGKLPQGMTWVKWRDLTPDQRQQELNVAVTQRIERTA